MTLNRLQMAALIALVASIVLVTLGSLTASSEYGPFLIGFNMIFQTLFWPLLAAQAAFQRFGTRLATVAGGLSTLIISVAGLLMAHGANSPLSINTSWVSELNAIGPGATIAMVLPIFTVKVGLTALIPFTLASLPTRKPESGTAAT